MSDQLDAFYIAEGDLFRGTRATVGPWNPALQHGSPPAALIGRALERLAPAGEAARKPDAEARIARMSIEILGPISLDPIAISAEVVRPGKKIELLTAEARAGGRTILRANAWRIAVAPERCPAVGVDEPPPPLPGPQPDIRFFEQVESFPYGDALEWRFVEGDYGQPGPAVVWTRLRIPLLRGEDTSPLCRLLAMVDSANGVSAELPLLRYTFVPVDLNIVLHRHPRGEWIGMDARTQIEPDGIGMTSTRLFDQHGYLGRSLHTLYVAPR